MPAPTVRGTQTRHTAEARLFQALRHPARLAILGVLREGEACVCHLEAALGYRQAYVQQLMVLREAGLVQDRRDGWNVFYHVSQPQVFVILEAARLAGEQPAPSRTDPQPASRLENCACPHCCPDSSPHKG